MRIRLLGLVAAAVAVAVGAMPVSADSAIFNPPKQYYLSLGDSLAFGFQNDRFVSELASGTYSPAHFPGYTYAFGDHMRTVDPRLNVVDYGCPSESTISFTTACAFQERGVPLHNGYAGQSQEQAALAFLGAHGGNVSPITVSLGANDLENGVSVAEIQANLTGIMGRLRAAAPYAEIIVLDYYNPLFFNGQPIPDAAIGLLDQAIDAAAHSAAARSANAFAVFNVATPPATEVTNICQLTLMCPGGVINPKGDFHPSDLGYNTIAGIFWDASGYDRLTD